ncbi:ROK family transcriptional regulator [Marinactinospora rubrisoli]|uniref:ROK family protein n=1 Tax=Marinactinospora rubrisoli TaxID=2715399 RepID=A0ABW2KBI8_9ACTN
MRESNLGLVLRAVRENAPCSRADVAAVTGLTKATVSSLVADLMAHGLVRETGAAPERRVGRPGVMLALDGRRIAAVGLEVNVDYLTVVAVDLMERELLSRQVPFDAGAAGDSSRSAAARDDSRSAAARAEPRSAAARPDPRSAAARPDPRSAAARAEPATERLAALVRETLADPLLSGRTVLGISVAVPGLVDSPAGVVTDAPNLRWSGFPLRDRLRALLDAAGLGALPLLVDNDANLGAVAEYRSGHLAHTPDLVYLTGEVGIGAGVLVNGRPLRGSRGFGGEIGHIPLARRPRCGCGRYGCLEALAGVQAIVRRTVPDLVPAGPVTGSLVATAVAATVERARAGDADVLHALSRAGGWLGRGVATVVNLLNPRAVLLGGYFVPLAPWLLPPCTAELDAHVIAPDRGGCQVAASTLGLTAAARGGAAALVDALDTGRLPLPPPLPPTTAGTTP